MTFEEALQNLSEKGYRVGKPWVHEKDGRRLCRVDNITRAADWIIREAEEGRLPDSVPLRGRASDMHAYDDEHGPDPAAVDETEQG